MPKRKREEKQKIQVSGTNGPSAEKEVKWKDGQAGWEEINSLFETKKQVTQDKKKQEKKQAGKKQEEERPSKKSSSKRTLRYNRQDSEGLGENEWVDDGLGGKFNKEGYTGRVEGGVKIFKAHLFNRPNFGNTDRCPFDCDCCFI